MPCPICRDPRTPGNEPCPIHASYGEEIEPTVRRQSGSSPPPPAADEPLSEIEPTVIRNLSRPRSGDFAAFELEPTDIRDISAVVSEPTQLSDPLIGKQIGEYVVRRAIGAGGMGIVYEGFQPLLERRVAIKFLRPETGQDPSHVSRLLAEARAANAVRHRGIIDVFGFGELPGFGQYMVMEFLEGSPLDAILQQRAPLPAREAIRILDEVLAALGAAHARGVIHRDLKPSNIFLVAEPTGGDYVKLLDFGLAKRSHAPGGSTPQTRASVFVGTPEYMAPEQAMGKAVGPYTDLYACGIVAFEMLTGRLPFERGSALEIAMSQVQDPAPAPSSYVEGLSPLFEELILELLEKAPERRPASAEQVRARLREILEQLNAPQVRARAPAKPRSEARTDTVQRPRRGLWIALGAAVVLAAGGGLWIAAGTGATEPPPTAVSTDPQPAGPARQPEPTEENAPDEPSVAATAPAAPDSVEEPPKQPEPAAPADQAVAVRPDTPGAGRARAP